MTTTEPATTTHSADADGDGDAGSARTADLAAIERVVAVVEHSQRHKDPEEFLALFHPDAVWTTAHGKVLIGLDAIAAFTRKVLPAAEWDGEVTYEVVHTLFVRPDVAAVKVRQRYVSPGAESEGAPLYVMARQDDGRWLLTACQNTGVVTADH
ncbi:SgcJ/EcaC family oxidoreductase [Streptomyces sp. NPDC004311]|uniref:SgcJ/EcaC family oxidoreductase n=1 Tax=unclassified Streptomyces TaxID=2593676 RepID=UPI003685A36C